MNWDALCEDYCNQNSCSDVHLQAAKGLSDKGFNKLRQDRADITRALNAVKAAYEQDPNASRKVMRQQAYKFIGSSIIIGILVQALLGIIVRKAIEWFLDRVFEQKEKSNGHVSLSSK